MGSSASLEDLGSGVLEGDGEESLLGGEEESDGGVASDGVEDSASLEVLPSGSKSGLVMIRGSWVLLMPAVFAWVPDLGVMMCC